MRTMNKLHTDFLLCCANQTWCASLVQWNNSPILSVHKATDYWCYNLIWENVLGYPKPVLTMTGPLPVVEAVTTAALTAALSQHMEGIPAGHTVLLRWTPAACAGLMADCRQRTKSVHSRWQKRLFIIFLSKVSRLRRRMLVGSLVLNLLHVYEGTSKWPWRMTLKDNMHISGVWHLKRNKNRSIRSITSVSSS